MNKTTFIDINEAPNGFQAVLKSDIHIPNVCTLCDARKLCQENNNNWCLTNRCMSYTVIASKDGKEYKREDGCSVVFKKIKL